MNDYSFRIKRSLLLSMIGLMAVLAGCSNGEEAGGHPEMAQPVTVVTVSSDRIVDSLELLGSLNAKDSVNVSFVREGRIQELPLEEGREVKGGDLLAGLDVRLARAALAQAEAAYNLAKADLQRSQQLYEGRTISVQEYDQAKSAYEVAEATRQRYQEELADMEVLAPFDGVIGKRYVSKGRYVTAGEAIARLVALDPMEVVFNVPERYLSRVELGNTVRIRVDAFPDRLFEGKVIFLDPEVDPITRTVPMKAVLPNADHLLRDGMMGRLELVMEEREDALIVPEEALIFRGKSQLVMVVGEDDRVSEREVKTGRRLAKQVEILEGLERGDRVIVEGVQKVWPGAKVQPKVREQK